MSEPFLDLANRILDDLNEIEIVVEHAQEGWCRFQRGSDNYYLGGIALDLHSFYNGLERIFESIAVNIDKSLPQEAKWHKVLLEQMSKEIPRLRPALISEQTHKTLDEYRVFRHLIRNIYTHKINPTKMENLVENLPKIFQQTKLELLAFVRFLEKQAESH
jgi:hypothetical protein